MVQYSWRADFRALAWRLLPRGILQSPPVPAIAPGLLGIVVEESNAEQGMKLMGTGKRKPDISYSTGGGRSSNSGSSIPTASFSEDPRCEDSGVKQSHVRCILPSDFLYHTEVQATL